jgi:hypothetical protein
MLLASDAIDAAGSVTNITCSFGTTICCLGLAASGSPRAGRHAGRKHALGNTAVQASKEMANGDNICWARRRLGRAEVYGGRFAHNCRLVASCRYVTQPKTVLPVGRSVVSGEKPYCCWFELFDGPSSIRCKEPCCTEKVSDDKVIRKSSRFMKSNVPIV